MLPDPVLLLPVLLTAFENAKFGGCKQAEFQRLECEGLTEALNEAAEQTELLQIAKDQFKAIAVKGEQQTHER